MVFMAWGSLIAQGPPVFLDSCLVTGSQRFKEIPVPGKFVPGTYEALRACPSLGNSVVKLHRVKAGKARNLRMELQMENGKLIHVQVEANGEKDFKRLYKQVISQAGIPSKMVESQGMLSYSWELRSKLGAHIEFHHLPSTDKGVVTIFP